MSAKNLLQEEVVKYGLGAITYCTTREAGSADHDARFVCTIRMENSGLHATSDAFSTKKKAEQSAAALMYALLKEQRVGGAYSVTGASNADAWCSSPDQAIVSILRTRRSKKKVHVLVVDLDCVHSFARLFSERADQSGDVFCIGFCSNAYAAYAAKHALHSTNMLHMIAHGSSRRDATDMRMVAFACACLLKPAVVECVRAVSFVSKDHMADAAAEAINDMLPAFRLKTPIEVRSLNADEALQVRA